MSDITISSTEYPTIRTTGYLIGKRVISTNGDDMGVIEFIDHYKNDSLLYTRKSETLSGNVLLSNVIVLTDNGD